MSAAAGPAGVEALLHRDRVVLVAGIGAMVAIAGAYTVLGVGMPASMDRAMPVAWTPAYAAVMVAMWWLMMVAMMVPSAAPTTLLYTALLRKSQPSAAAVRMAWTFLSGYLVAWALFSVLATALQWLLELRGLASPAAMRLASGALGGAVLIAAGAYQFTPLKRACLDRCRSPLAFLVAHRRPGYAGAFRMGALHGAYCLGCCTALMALLFVGGIMSLYWIVGLAIVVAIEKLAPAGARIGRAIGAGLLAAGVWMLVQAVTAA